MVLDAWRGFDAACEVDEPSCVLIGQLGHGRVEFLRPRQVDVAALHMHVGEDADGHVAAACKLYGKSFGHFLHGCFTEVTQHTGCHILGDECVLVIDFACEGLQVAGADVLVSGNRFLGSEGSVALVQLSFVTNQLIFVF